ncbi:MAG: WYL domain-containing protein [Nitrospirota bacterium]
MARGDQALRQWKILTTVMSHARYGVTQQQLLEELRELLPRGKGKRTLQRDLQVLEQAGFPLDRTARSKSGQILYRFLPGFQHVPPLMPAVPELISLAVARSLLTMYDGTPFKDDLDAFWKKAQAIFPDEARAALEEAQSLYVVLDRPGMDFTRQKPIMRELDRAIRDRRRLEMTYGSPKKGERQYLIDPLNLLFHGRCLYLAAYTHNYKEIRHFSLDRIKKISPTGETFTHQAQPVDKMKREAFGLIWEEPFDLVVRFDKEVAYYVKGRVHHPSQRIEEQPDGGVIVRIRAGGWDAMKCWILTFAQHAEVLEPKALREEIKKDLEEMRVKYR